MVKTADRPHPITILVSISALALSLFSLQQSCSAQRATKATSRAMLVLKSAQLRGPANIWSYGSNLPYIDYESALLFQVENVGKAIARSPRLQYDLEATAGAWKGVWRGAGTIKFMDDPPATPVVGEGKVSGQGLDPTKQPGGVLIFPDLTLHYRLSYDDEATGTHFDEKESCGQFSLGDFIYIEAPGRPKPQLPKSRSGSFPMLPCPPK
jgi:hypothetical protein